MARVTPETVARVAKLARLSLDDAERAAFARQLDEIVSYADGLQALDLEGVPAMSHAGGASAFRGDDARDAGLRDKGLEAAPDAADGLFRVPKIIAG